jgi:hypothetical protein
MPVTWEQHEKKLDDPALCEQLPVRDYLDNVLVRTNGALVAGYELRGIASYFASDEERDRAKVMLGALLKSIPEQSMRVQVRYEVVEDVANLFEVYTAQDRSGNEIGRTLDSERLEAWQQKAEAGHYLRPVLHICLIWDPAIHHRVTGKVTRRSPSWSLSAKASIERSRREHEELLAEFESLLVGIEATMQAADLGPRRLNEQELFLEAKRALNPLDSDTRPYTPGEDHLEYRSARQQLANVSIVDETDSYLNVGGIRAFQKELLCSDLPGHVLHSEAAKKNGGDFDFDWICILEESRFPRFVRKRFSLTNEFHQQKMKLRKAKSPWWNLEHVAIKARGNQIGMITDLKTSCLAVGRSDLAHQLVTELQKALDSLKHEVEPDAKIIADIRQQVNPAPWLKYKNESRISGLPIHLDVDENDRIGKLYNHVRKEIEDLLTAKLPIEEFKGLVSGESVTRVMFDECRYVNSVYAAVVGRISERQDKLKADLDRAQAEWEAVRKGSDKELRKQKLQARRKAYSAHYHGEERAKQEMKAIISYVRVWAASKTDNRMGWCQALNRVVCNGQGSGSILFHAFPQELVAKLAEQTGGKTVRVVVPEVSGMSIFRDSEGRSFLVEKIEGGEKQTFLFQYKDGQFFFG